jgi:hypothetical protein
VRKRNLEEMKIPQPLKQLLFRCLGGESERPSLSELRKCIKDLMRELILKENALIEASKKSAFHLFEDESGKGKGKKGPCRRLKLISVR